MKILKTFVVLLVLVVTFSCTSGKTSKNDTESETIMADTKKMMANGFTMGTIVASTAEGDCPYVISSEIDGDKVMYDPIDMGDNFKKDGMKVWYKYRPLRMANRCVKANPVSIEEIQSM
ncbi:hypothetical protein [Rasiella sp. SM2506]|uniref:hypothetical protein n=1 Tax=Rasiella sp. SM2506 TaxID=3423914 RepID=UPI003D7B67B2